MGSNNALDLSRWAPSITAFADWIDCRNPQEARLWASELRHGAPDQVEGRVAEAVAWDWLVHRVDSMASIHEPNQPTPDFRCGIADSTFWVEVTNVSRASMTEVTGLEDGERKPGSYGSPADILHRKILEKGNQGAKLHEPYLVFVTTLHRNASSLLMHRGHVGSVLHSQEFLQGDYGPDLGQVGELRSVVDFRRAAFTKSRTLNKARSHISGALFGPFGCYPTDMVVHGILNPEADHAFEPAWLEGARFGRFTKWPPTFDDPVVQVEWTDGTGRCSRRGPAR